MESTTLSSRVPALQAILNDTPSESGLAPDISGLDSDTVSLETNEEVALNLSRRAASDTDDDRPPKPLTSTNNTLRPKASHIFSTFNARTLAITGRTDELVHCCNLFRTEILAIQEHRMFHPDEELRTTMLNQYQLITSSCTKNSVNASVGGVGFLISTNLLGNLEKKEPISPRIMLLEFSGNPKLTVICAYSPHNEAPESDVDEFYTDLRSVMESIPPHNFVSILGDFNAKLGPDTVNFTFNDKTNRNGEKLVDFMEEYSLFTSNNSFMKPKNQLWTYESPLGIRSQLDYVLFRKKWRNSVHNSRSFSTFTVSSDHRVVSSTIKLSLRTSKPCKPHHMKCYDWRKVAADKDLSQAFSLEVYNRFCALSDVTLVENSVEDTYDTLISCTEEVAKEMLPSKQKANKNNAQISTPVVVAREKLKSVSLEYHKNPSNRLKQKLTRARKDLDAAYLNAEADFIKGKIATLEHLHHSNKHHEAWKTVKELSGKNSNAKTSIKGGSAKARMDSWYNHFKNLLGKSSTLSSTSSLPMEEVSPELNIPTSPFTLDELKSAIRTMKSSKAFGPDNIPTIIWKDEHFHELLLNLCNYCAFDHKICPTSWRKSQIIPVPKKGNLSLVTNYRGISLIPIAAKIFNKLLLNRIVPHIDPLLRNNQNGFRSGRSTLSQILLLRRLIEEMSHCNRDLALVFVDFSKAFDSVDRNMMFKILKLYGIPSTIIEAIRVLYTDTSATVLSPDGETSPFDICAGILQGDTLAPFLFIIVVDYVLRMSVDKINDNGLMLHPRKSSRNPAVHITDADFADDIALIAGTLANAQNLLHSLESAANSVGLFLNETKTEYINQTSDILSHIKTLAGTILKEKDDYVYLGSHISSSEKDFMVRKGMAWSACNNLHKIWISKLDTKIKIQLFKCLIEPILLYGCETWTLSKKAEKRLDGTYTRLLMRVKNLSWKHHPTKHQIYGSLPPVSSIVQSKRVQFAGHCLRASSEIISPVVLYKSHSIGRRSRKLNYIDTIKRDTGLLEEDLKTSMLDRECWRKVVNSLISTTVAT